MQRQSIIVFIQGNTIETYGNLQSYYHFNIDELIEYPETIADYITENFEEFEDLFN